MFEILTKFFRFSGRENGNKFKLSMVIGLVEALASAMKIPAIMYILIGLLGGKPIGKYIGGSLAIMVTVLNGRKPVCYDDQCLSVHQFCNGFL